MQLHKSPSFENFFQHETDLLLELDERSYVSALMRGIYENSDFTEIYIWTDFEGIGI